MFIGEVKMKKLKNINIIFLIIIILLSTLLIGTPLSENTGIIYIISGIYGIIYFFRKIIKKEKIELNKIDIFVIILCFSTIIPYIARSYVSLEETINCILKYMSLLVVYLISRQEISKNEKYENILVNTIIFSIFLLCVIGLDEINLNLLKDFKIFIGYNQVQYDEVRIASLFSYPNTMAIVSGLGIFLTLSMLINTNKVKYKILYLVIGIIMLITFILTYSRLAYIFFTLFLILYIVLILKKYDIYKKINKKIIIAISSILVISILYIIVGLNIADKVEISNYYQKIFYNMTSNTDYKFSFEMKATGKEEDVKIILTEKNRFFDDVNRIEIPVGGYEGNKEILLHTKENTQVIYLEIEAKENSKIEINNSYLNNKKLILKYKILPTNIVNKIESISINNKSAWERFVFIEDALKLVKDNWLFGLGGNAWRITQTLTQQYNYYSSEVHSFLVQTFLEYGIIGFIAATAIIISLLYIFIKKIKDRSTNVKYIGILLGVLFVLAHSMLDFDMSFYYCLITVFLLMSIIIDSNNKEVIELKNEKRIYIYILFYVIIIILLTLTTYVSTISLMFEYKKENLIVSDVETEEQIYDKYYACLPFNKKIKIRLYNVSNDKEKNIKILKELIENEKYDLDNITLINLVEYVKLLKKENLQMDEQYILEKIKETQNLEKYNPMTQFMRLNNIIQIVTLADNNKEIQEQFLDEIENKKQYILDAEKCRYNQDHVDIYKKEIERIEKNENISINANI